MAQPTGQRLAGALPILSVHQLPLCTCRDTIPLLQLAQWLRLEAFWAPGSQIFPAHVTRATGTGVLCRMYICVSMGVLEPLVLASVLLLCRGPLGCAGSCQSARTGAATAS